MTMIGGLRGRDWGTQYLDESGQWIQSDSGNDSVYGHIGTDEQANVGLPSRVTSGYLSGGTHEPSLATALAIGTFEAPAPSTPLTPPTPPAPAPVAAAAPVLLSVTSPPPQAVPPSVPATPAALERSADEWASIAAAWSGNQGNFYRLYQTMDEHGWDAADIAHVSGLSLQDVGDYFTRGGAPAGFGGAVTLGRDAVDAPYLAALAAEEAHPPTSADAARPWWTVATPTPWSATNESGMIVDESGNARPVATFDLSAFTAWFVGQNTPQAQAFSRVHGAYSADGAGGLRFASGAAIHRGGFGEAGEIVASTMSWSMDQRITQYAGYAKGNPLDQAAMQAIVQSPLAQQFLQTFAPASLAKGLPDNELGERMRALYGSDLATFMFQVQDAFDAMRSQYMSDLNATLAQKPTFAGVQSPFWIPGAIGSDESGHPLIDESGHVQQTYSFDAAGYQQWYTQQPDLRHQLIGMAWGSGALATGDGFRTTGALDSLHLALSYDENATPSARDVTLTDGGLSEHALTEIDIGNAPDLYNAGGVGFMPMRGFVTASDNIKPDDDWLDQLIPMLFVAAVAYLSAGTLGPAAAGAMGFTTTVAATGATVLTTTGMIVSAAVAGAITSAVSGAINDNFSFKGMLQGALAGALTAGLLQGVESATGLQMTGPASSDLVTAGRIAAQATVQGTVQALLGGSFKDGAIAGLASGLASAVGGQLEGSIKEAIKSGVMTAAEGAAARYFSSMLSASIRIVGSGEGTAGYALASAFVSETLSQLRGPEPSGSGLLPGSGSGGIRFGDGAVADWSQDIDDAIAGGDSTLASNDTDATPDFPAPGDTATVPAPPTTHVPGNDTDTSAPRAAQTRLDALTLQYGGLDNIPASELRGLVDPLLPSLDQLPVSTEPILLAGLGGELQALWSEQTKTAAITAGYAAGLLQGVGDTVIGLGKLTSTVILASGYIASPGDADSAGKRAYNDLVSIGRAISQIARDPLFYLGRSIAQSVDGITGALDTANASDNRSDWFLYGATVGRVTFDVASLVLGAAGLAEGATSLASKLTTYVAARNATVGGSVMLNASESGIGALERLTPVSPTASGNLSATAFNSAGYSLIDLTPVERNLALQVMTKGDGTGQVTEKLVGSVAQRQGWNALGGGKYGSNNGFDHVFQRPDGTTVILLDSKQITNGATSVSINAAGGTVQMSDAWVRTVLRSLDQTSPAWQAVNDALNSGTLAKGIIGVDRTSGNVVMIRLN